MTKIKSDTAVFMWGLKRRCPLHVLKNTVSGSGIPAKRSPAPGGSERGDHVGGWRTELIDQHRRHDIDQIIAQINKDYHVHGAKIGSSKMPDSPTYGSEDIAVVVKIE